MNHFNQHLIYILVILWPLYSQPDPEPIFFMRGSFSQANLGKTLNSWGDLNNDGYDDFSFSARDSVGAPRTHKIYFGGNPPDTIPDIILGQNIGIQTVDDLNNDGYKDFIWGYWEANSPTHIGWGGNPPILDTSFSIHNFIMAGGMNCPWKTGDLNDDGNGDILFRKSEYYILSDSNSISVYYGGNSISNPPDLFITKEHPFTNTPFPGKYNDYLYYDFSYYQSGVQNTIETPDSQFIHFGPDLSLLPDFTFETLQFSYLDSLTYTFRLRYIDDFNGDGWEEIILYLSPLSSFGGQIIIKGGPNLDYNDPEIITQIPTYYGEVGLKPFPVGDVNGDGYNDFVLHSSHVWVYLGAVKLFLGGPSISSEETLIWSGGTGTAISVGGNAGETIARGDFNGDGINDILFNCFNPGSAGEGYNPRGHVYIFAGDTNWVNPSVALEKERVLIPKSFELKPPYPNPFNSEQTIEYSLTEKTPIELYITDLIGRRVKTIVDKTQEFGTYRLKWNPEHLSSGMYFIVLKSDNTKIVQKTVFLK